MSELHTLCTYCGRKVTSHNFTWDHVFPKSKGGREKDNLVICCHDCNQFKDNHTLKEWLLIVGVLLRLRLPYKTFSLATLGQIKSRLVAMIPAWYRVKKRKAPSFPHPKRRKHAKSL
jgi:hypothetical protein